MASAEALKFQEGDHVVYIKSVVDAKEVAPCYPGARVEFFVGIYGKSRRESSGGVPHLTPVKGPSVDIAIMGASVPTREGETIWPRVYSNGFLRVEHIDGGSFRCLGDKKLEQQLAAAGFGTRFRYVGRSIEFLSIEQA